MQLWLGFLDKLFFDGLPSADGSKLVAALTSSFHRWGGTGDRAVQGWSQLAPGNMRLPLPWICVAAILGTMIASQKVEEARTMQLYNTLQPATVY